ncbi:NAD(P)-dependent oxidoreductase [Sphingomonas sp. CROZ-RG-20F-R02-07]|uniref:NAD(P)-dependent oxidoreductase n=1 Tax=Sphingomonas sp. CROZ-RG-20F-R02-07 TaxID=2914832 RepID=UPI001F595575|nr:NAD(P)-dependent oxidoreductase [Sphingomonas sp. CROZ-RG-20F-R02-07]
MSDNLRLGFVGFGAMPRRMAARLRDAGHPVIAFDVAHHGESVDGFRLTDSSGSLAGEVDAILVAVPNDAALYQSMIAHGGALDGGRDGQVIINFSTVSPQASKSLAEAATAKGVGYVEAPMSGSTHEAETGQLVFLAGGSDDDVAAAMPILDVVGRKTVHVGAVGNGAVTKLIINGVMALGTAALAEGLAYGDLAGLDRGQLIDILSDLILVSQHHKHKLTMAKAQSYPAEFPTRLMSKDMGLLLADARERGASMPSMAAAAQLYAYAGRVRPNDDYASAISVAETLAQS